MVGKVPLDILRKYIFCRIGVSDPDVIVGPGYGEDSAVIDLGDRVLVVHVDPITGAVDWLGWLAVHISCNDIAVTGAKPRWLLSVLYFPEDASEELIDTITKQIDNAAKEVGVMVVGGHSEYTPGLNRPLISMTAIGLASKDKYVRTSGAKPGDSIIMTKTAAIEGTAILSTDFAHILRDKGVDNSVLKRASNFIKNISVLPEALVLTDVGVNSMHDPTEGGILGGLAEIAYSSNVKLEVWEDKIPVAEETKIICDALKVDPLKLISSGVLIASVPQERVEQALNEIHSLGIKASVIGKVEEGSGVIIHRKDGSTEQVGKSVVDELFRIWKIYE